MSNPNTQQIERKHLTLRTRIKGLARQTLCFSKSVLMHGTVMGLSIAMDLGKRYNRDSTGLEHYLKNIRKIRENRMLR